MKKAILILLAFLILILIALLTMAQAKQAKHEHPAIKEVAPFTYFCLRYKGPFTDMEKVIGQMIQAMQSQKLIPGGPMIGVYYNDPSTVKPEELEWEVGFKTNPQAAVQAPLEKKQWNFTSVATLLHVGPYEATGQTIAKIMEWMNAHGHVQNGPVMEAYLDMDPSKVKPEELRTEISVPCAKK